MAGLVVIDEGSFKLPSDIPVIRSIAEAECNEAVRDLRSGILVVGPEAASPQATDFGLIAAVLAFITLFAVPAG